MSTYQDNAENCFQPDTLNLIPLVYQTILFTFYGIIMAFSCCGNAVVMVVQVISFRKSPKSRNICKYLFSLALSDIIHGGVLLPFHSTSIVYGAWIYPSVLCPYVQYLELMSVFNTSLTLALLGIERFLVTVHPFSNACSTLKKYNSLLLLNIWLIGAAYAYIPFGQVLAEEFEIADGEVYVQCLIDFRSNPQLGHLFMTVNFVITYLIPICTLAFSCWTIRRELTRTSYNTNRESVIMARLPSSVNNNNSNNSDQVGTFVLNSVEIHFRRSASLKTRKTKTLRLLLITVATYFICWTPVKVYQMLAHFGIVWYCSAEASHWTLYFYIAINLLAMTNSLVNPILYSFLSDNFLKDFRRIFRFRHNSNAPRQDNL